MPNYVIYAGEEMIIKGVTVPKGTILRTGVAALSECIPAQAARPGEVALEVDVPASDAKHKVVDGKVVDRT